MQLRTVPQRTRRVAAIGLVPQRRLEGNYRAAVNDAREVYGRDNRTEKSQVIPTTCLVFSLLEVPCNSGERYYNNSVRESSTH
jgi:hypothetical protein